MVNGPSLFRVSIVYIKGYFLIQIALYDLRFPNTYKTVNSLG